MLLIIGTKDLISPLAELTEARHEERIGGIEISRGKLADKKITLISTEDTTSPDPLRKALTSYKADQVLMLGTAHPLVPYVQNGDFIAASAITCLTDPDQLHDDKLPSADWLCNHRTILRLQNAYSEAFTGRGDRPQLVAGTVIASSIPVTDLKIIAQLQRELGTVGQTALAYDMSDLTSAAKSGVMAIYAAIDENETDISDTVIIHLKAILAQYVSSTTTEPRRKVANPL
jgi:hypothetical protein